jgi:hypothetical protein
MDGPPNHAEISSLPIRKREISPSIAGIALTEARLRCEFKMYGNWCEASVGQVHTTGFLNSSTVVNIDHFSADRGLRRTYCAMGWRSKAEEGMLGAGLRRRGALA